MAEHDRPDEPARAGPTSAAAPCEACGARPARMWATPDGPARLCPPCATLHGFGCP